MKKLSRIVSLVIVAIFSFSMFVACGTKPVTLKKELPTEIDVNEDLNFKNYYEAVDGATYNLYVSYTDPVTGEEVEEEKLRSKIFSFEFAAVYTFKIEQVIKGKSSFLEATIECLPDQPDIGKGKTATVSAGATRTWLDLINATDTNIKPADLIEKAKFTKVTVEKATYATTDTDPVFTVEETIAGDATGYTFEYEALYTFDFSVENKKGSAEGQIVISTIDAVRAATKAETTFVAEEKTISWTAVENATGYRVQVDDTYEDITATSYVFTNVADGEHNVTVSPIYGNLIYTSSAVSELLYIGAVKTALPLSVRTHTVSWTARPFAVSYEVKENGGEAVTLPKTATSYTLTGTTYKTHDEVKVEVVAVFDDQSKTDNAEATVTYGVATLAGMDLSVSLPSDTSWANAKVAEEDSIEFIDYGEVEGNVWIMTEFEGRNAPNYAYKATQAFSSIDFETPGTRPYWTKAGIFLSNSFVGGKMGYPSFHTGFYSDVQEHGSGVRGGAIDYNTNFTNAIHATDLQDAAAIEKNKKSGAVKVEGENSACGFGMYNFKNGTKYIQIVGFQGVESNTSQLLLTLIALQVEEDGSLTVLTNITLNGPSGRGPGVSSSTFPGKHVILYPNVNHPTVKTGDITFAYYPVAHTLADVINGSTSAYKDGMKAKLNIA